MLFQERQREIMTILKERKSATVWLLANRLFVSPATIRRDLIIMEQNNLLLRVHGGAVLPPTHSKDQPHLLRKEINTSAKESISKVALRYLENGSICFFDSSSTVSFLAKAATGRKENLTVITNGLDTLNILGEESDFSIIATGGVYKNNSCLLGHGALSSIDRYYADCVFFSCCGISAHGSITEAEEENAAVKSKMLSRATKKILLCDSSKLDTQFLSVTCGLKDIDLLITEKKPENYNELSDLVKIVWK